MSFLSSYPFVLLHPSPDSDIEDASLLLFLSIDLPFPQSTAAPIHYFGNMITILIHHSLFLTSLIIHTKHPPIPSYFIAECRDNPQAFPHGEVSWLYLYKFCKELIYKGMDTKLAAFYEYNLRQFLNLFDEIHINRFLA